MQVDEFQRHIEAIYHERDKRRGLDGTFRWFIEEVGELAAALRDEDKSTQAGEFADVLAWLSTLASLRRIELAEAVKKYSGGCPVCRAIPCDCPEK